MTRATLWVLLPFCIVGSLLLVSQGVVQNLKPYDRVQLVDPQTVTTTDAGGTETTTTISEQVIAQGPVASQEFIKEWGTNGGGFFNANSCPSVREPDAVLELHRDVRDLRHLRRAHLHARPDDEVAAPWLGGWAAMAFLFLAGVTTAYWAEAAGNPMFAGTDQTAGACALAGTWRARKSRFGIANSALFATVTTDASCGAVNSMHDSFTPARRHGAPGQHHAR